MAGDDKDKPQDKPKKRLVVSTRPSKNTDPLHPEHKRVVESPVDSNDPPPFYASQAPRSEDPKIHIKPSSAAVSGNSDPKNSPTTHNDESDNMTAETQQTGQPPSPPRSPFSNFLSFIAFIAVIGLGFWVYQTHEKKDDLTQALENNQQEIEALKARLEVTTNEQESTRGALQTSLEKLSQQLSAQADRLGQMGGTESWKMQEARYLTVLAMERLQAFQDIPTALQLLKDADARLKNMADPRVNQVRESLTEDILHLQEAQKLDYTGLWAKLNVLSKKVDDLTFHKLDKPRQESKQAGSEDRTQEKAAQKGWRKALDNTWQELKGLIKVRDYRPDTLANALTAQEQTQLQRSLDLLIEEAKWGVLNQNKTVYQGSLSAILQQLNQFFVDNASRDEAIDLLQSLQQASMATDSPDISGTLDAIDAYLAHVGSQSELKKPKSEKRQSSGSNDRKPAQEPPQKQENDMPMDSENENQPNERMGLGEDVDPPEFNPENEAQGDLPSALDASEEAL